MKKMLLVIFALNFLLLLAAAQEEIAPEEAVNEAPEEAVQEEITQEDDVPEDISEEGRELPSAEAEPEAEPIEAELVDPGVTPDSAFYFVEEFVERFTCNSPEAARECWEEKIAEAREVAKKKDSKAVQKAFAHGSRYAVLLEKEATPEMENILKEKAGAVKAALNSISDELPELKDDVEERLEETERVALAAEVAGKIKQLCETLSRLDPQQYAETCRQDGEAPAWHRKLDRELTGEQREKAERFKAVMLQCMDEPENCPCNVGIKSFDDACRVESRLFAACRQGDQESCMQMGRQQFELPDYLVGIMDDLQEEFAEKFQKMSGQFRQEMPGGFEGDFDGFPDGMPQRAMVPGQMPGEMQEMMAFMEECGQEKQKQECMREAMERFGVGGGVPSGMVPPGQLVRKGPPARIAEFGRDCHAIQDLQEKVRCFEDFYNQASSDYVEYRIEFGEEEEVEGGEEFDDYQQELYRSFEEQRRQQQQFEDQQMPEREEQQRQFEGQQPQFEEQIRQFEEQYRQESERQQQEFEEEQQRQLGEQYRQGIEGQQYPQDMEQYRQQIEEQYQQGIEGQQYPQDIEQYEEERAASSSENDEHPEEAEKRIDEVEESEMEPQPAPDEADNSGYTDGYVVREIRPYRDLHPITGFLIRYFGLKE